MKFFWVTVVIILGVATLLFELVSYRREKKVQSDLSEAVSPKTVIDLWKTRIFFLGMFFLLFFSFSVAAYHQRWVVPKQGITFVIDPQSQSSDEMALKKSIVSEVIQQFPGVEVGLYEMGPQSLQLVVPLTIDRLFFSLLLDGIEKSVPFDPLSLSEVCDRILASSAIPPWVVVVSSRSIPPGTGHNLEGISFIQFRDKRPVIYSFSEHRPREDASITALTTRIDQQLQLSAEPVEIDRLDFLTLACAVGFAWLLYVFWRKREVPLFIGVLLVTSPLSALSHEEANRSVQMAQEFMEANDYEQAQKHIEKTLAFETDPQARGRLLYDLSLLVYLQGRDEEAWADLHMEQATLDPVTQSLFTSLEGLILLRLSSHDPQNIWKEKLRVWLASKPSVAEEILNNAVMTFSRPVRSNDFLPFLIWLEQNEDQTANGSSEFINAFRRYIQQVDKNMFSSWQKQKAPEQLTNIRIWYEVSLESVASQKIAYLFDQALTLSQGAIVFPRNHEKAIESLKYIEKLLDEAYKSLSPEEQKLYSSFYSMTSKMSIDVVSTWFLRASLWKEVQRQSDQEIFAFLELVNKAMDLPVSSYIREKLCLFIRRWLAIPNKTNDEGHLCENVLSELLRMGYTVDAVATMEEILILVQKNPARWDQKLAALLRYAFSQDLKEPSQSLATSVSKDLETYDLPLLGRLWQLSISTLLVPQEVPPFLDHSLQLFEGLLSHFESPQEPFLKTFRLSVLCQPNMGKRLLKIPCFPKDVVRRQQYEALLQRFALIIDDIRARFEVPSTFRLERVRQDVEQVIQVLRQLRALFVEGELPDEGSSMSSTQETTSISFRKEDAVRMFQELDRSDRELYGR